MAAPSMMEMLRAEVAQECPCAAVLIPDLGSLDQEVNFLGGGIQCGAKLASPGAIRGQRRARPVSCHREKLDIVLSELFTELLPLTDHLSKLGRVHAQLNFAFCFQAPQLRLLRADH